MVIEFDVKMARILFETALAAFLLLLLMGPKFIPYLKKLKFGQEVREAGYIPENHQKKQGTPTMGGIMILISMTLASCIGFAALKTIPESALQILFLTLGYGAIGFADDYLKIKKHNSDGLSPKGKLLLQLAAAVVFSVWVWLRPETGIAAGTVYVPFTGFGEDAVKLSLPLWAFFPGSLLVILGADNGVNFTDGLDGLCSSVTLIVSLFFAVTGLLLSRGTGLAAAAAAGALAGFLIFNAFPAKVFMGDTGSLALGGFVGACAVISGLELYLVIVGFIYVAEVLSVIIQVTYFRATKGKRFFRMAPIHHHFELCGNSETRIVTAFTVLTAFLAGLAAVALWY